MEKIAVHAVRSLLPQLKQLRFRFVNESVLQSHCTWAPQLSPATTTILRKPMILLEQDEDLQLYPSRDVKQVKEMGTYEIETSGTGETGHCSLVVSLEDMGKYQQARDAHLLVLGKLQAAVKGFLARRWYRARMEFEKQRLQSIIKIQALWRGRATRGSCAKVQAAYLRRVITLQAMARGVLARKHVRKEKARLSLILRVQALWRGRKVRSSNLLENLHVQRSQEEAAILKLQAVWKGFRTRWRFQMAVRSSKYDDDDGFEYAKVEEIDILSEDLCLKDMEVFCHNKGTDDTNLETSQNILPLPVLGNVKVNTEREAVMSRSTEIPPLPVLCNLKVNVDTEMVVSLEDFTQGDLDPTRKMEGFRQTDVEKEVVDNMDVSHRKPVDSDSVAIDFELDVTDDMNVSSSSHRTFVDGEIHKDTHMDIAHNKIRQTTGGKQWETTDVTKCVMVEIAKDWGFKEEKTALQFLKALKNTRRRAEGPKAPTPDAQTRLRAFMARSGKHKGLPRKST